MRKNRFLIGAVVAVVLVPAIGFVALKRADETWAGAMFVLACGVLGLAVVGAVCRRETERAWWLGFALFGWGYMTLAFWPWEQSPGLPTLPLLDSIGPQFGVVHRYVPPGLRGGGGFLDPSFTQIGHCLWALGAAILGGLLAVALFGFPAGRTERPAPTAQPRAQPPGISWLRLTILTLTGLVLVTSTAAIGSSSAAGVWAGTAFLLTCGLLGLVILGALFGRGRRREICMGAALFGAGYLLLAFCRSSLDWSQSSLATDQLLNAVRQWSSPVPRNIVAANARILEALEQPIPMRFPNEIPFDDLLNYIKKATSTSTYPGIPMYFVGFQDEGDHSLSLSTQIDLEGVPLKTTLRLCLKQLGLAYSVQDGYLRISTEEDVVSSTLDDPFLIVGHCLLALLAGGLGGILAPMVSEVRRERPGHGVTEGDGATGRSSADRADRSAATQPG